MPKKDFKNNPALAFIGNPQPVEPETIAKSATPIPAPETQRTHDTQRTHGTPKYYRLNLKLKAEYKEYLDLVAWESRKSITQYLNDLIEADKATRDTQNT